MNLKPSSLCFFSLCILGSITFCQISSFNLIPNAKDTNLFYEAYRYYDPKLGRFTQPDTVVPTVESIDLNRYAYVRNNPIKYNDPSGHVPHRADDPSWLKNIVNSGIEAVQGIDQSLHATLSAGADIFALDIKEDPIGSLFFFFGATQGTKKIKNITARKMGITTRGGPNHSLASKELTEREIDNVYSMAPKFEGRIGMRSGFDTDDLAQNTIVELYKKKKWEPVYAGGTYLFGFMTKVYLRMGGFRTLRATRYFSEMNNDGGLQIPGEVGDVLDVLAMSYRAYPNISELITSAYEAKLDEIISAPSRLDPNTGHYARKMQDLTNRAGVATFRFRHGLSARETREALSLSRTTVATQSTAIAKELWRSAALAIQDAYGLPIDIDNFRISIQATDTRPFQHVDPRGSHFVQGGD